MSLYVTLTLSLFLKLYHGLQCKGWPNSGWCSDAGYEPSLKPGLWEQAWDENGECVITKAPSTSPTTLPPTCVQQGNVGCTTGTDCCTDQCAFPNCIINESFLPNITNPK